MKSKPLQILVISCIFATASCLSNISNMTTPEPTPSLTLAQALSSTPTYIPPTPTVQTFQVVRKCAQFLEDPASTFFDGTISLSTFKQGEDTRFYLLNLMTNQETSIGQGLYEQVSPDETKIAYVDLEFQSIVIADSAGILMQIVPNSGERLSPAGWLDDQRLMIDKYELDSSMMPISTSLIIIDIMTGSKQEWLPDYPNHIDNYRNISYDVNWAPSIAVVINPRFDYLIYPAWGDDAPIILWDMKSKMEVARIHYGSRRTSPRWSPDGTQFVISAPPQFDGYENIDDDLPNKGGNDLFLVSNTGVVKRLTYFATLNTSWQKFYHWSPDGQYIAFLLQTGDFGDIESGELAIVNVKTREVTQYCVGGIAYWTSDGRYILLSQIDENLNSRAYLLDPRKSNAYLIANDAVAIGGTIRNP
jgi:hypothetical protein